MEAAIDMSSCPACNTRTDGGQRFCRRCGIQLVPPPPSIEETSPFAVEPSTSRLWILVLALVAVLFLLLGGVAALVVADASDTPTQPPSTSVDGVSAATNP
jgi:hypothetical protein